jgi:hypothetical protein
MKAIKIGLTGTVHRKFYGENREQIIKETAKKMDTHKRNP